MGMQGEGGPDTCRTIIDMLNITIFYGRPTEFRPHFSEVGPRQIFSLTPNEVNKTIKLCSLLHGHGN